MALIKILRRVLCASLLAPAAFGAVILRPDPFAAPQSLGPSPVEARVANALGLADKGQWDAAEKALLAAERSESKSPMPRLGLAELEIRRQHYDVARKHLERALAVAPNDFRPANAMGRYFVFRKDFAQAETWLKKGAALGTRDALVQVDLGDLYLEALRKPVAAEAAYRAAIAANGSYAGGYYGLGRALRSEQRWDEALEAFRAATQRAPRSAAPAQALGDLLAFRKRYVEAQREYDRILKVAPFASILLARAEVLLAQRKSTDALRDFDAVIAQQSNLDMAHWGRGRALEASGKVNDAKQAYRASLAQNPGYAPALNSLAWLMLKTHDDLAQAEQFARRAADAAPQLAAVYDTLGAVYRAQSKTAQARAAYQKAVQLDPNLQSSVTALRELGARAP